MCPAPSHGLGVLPGPGRCRRAGEHRAEPGPLSGRAVLAENVLGWERGASRVSHPSILLLIPLCQSRTRSPRSSGVDSALEALGRARRWRRDGWDVHVLFPAPTTLWWQALARGTIPGGIPLKGRVPTASLAVAAAWGRCPSLVGQRRAWQGGGHTGPICFQLQERVRHGSEAAFPLAKIDLKRDKPSPAPGQPAGIFLS